jgi:6-phosphogluconate dehydrogenase
MRASKIFDGPKPSFRSSRKIPVEDLHKAMYASKIVSYAQGFMLLRQAAKQFNWHLNFGAIAQVWRGGCIIRSRFLGEIKRAFDKNPHLENILLDDFFREAIEGCQKSWRKTVSFAVESGIPAPALTAALAFFDGYRHGWLPANLIQAQRDYFGAHTYERTDRPRGQFFHTNWTGRGGQVASGSYNA